MNIRALLVLLTLSGGSLSAQNVFTTFTIPADSPNVGSFTVDRAAGGSSLGLDTLADLNTSGSDQYNFAWQYFTPVVGGTYSFGVQSATYDPVLIVYTGIVGFPAGAIAIDDDGHYTNFHGLPLSNTVPAGPAYNPIIENMSLSAGSDYLVLITSFSPGTTIPLPTSFFVYGPSQVGVGGEPAIPEPSTYAALLGFAALGIAVLRRRTA